MHKASWTIDQFKKRLQSRKEVKAWTLVHEHVRRRERYFMLDGAVLVADQDRDVRTQTLSAKILVRLPKSDRQGEITKKFFMSLPLDEQIEAALAAAEQTDHQAWEIQDAPPASLPVLATADPRIAEDVERVMGDVTAEIAKSTAKKRPTIFNSAELFISTHDRELHLSNGLVHRSSQSRIYVEAAYSMTRQDPGGEPRSDEYLNTAWAVNLDDLPIAALFDQTSERAEHSLDVLKPTTGRYSVIVDSEVLATLLAGLISQLSAANAYNGLPFVKIGDELIGSAEGDLLTITLDPWLEFGGDTLAVSEQGVAQSPLKLVDRNRVVATATDKQYADYLGIPATSARGNVVVEGGSATHAELTAQAPLVVEILQFSGLFADANSGTFSSEIRLARLYDNVRGTVSYLKGGCLSGSIRENFKKARLSRNRIKRAHFSANSMQGQGYFGPEYALLSDVSIVG